MVLLGTLSKTREERLRTETRPLPHHSSSDALADDICHFIRAHALEAILIEIGCAIAVRKGLIDSGLDYDELIPVLDQQVLLQRLQG